MTRTRTLTLLLVLLAGCSSPAPPTGGGEEMTTYTSADRRLTLSYPRDWSVSETSAFDVAFEAMPVPDDELRRREEAGDFEAHDGEFVVELFAEADAEGTTVEAVLEVECVEQGSVVEILECEQETINDVVWAWIHVKDTSNGTCWCRQMVTVRGNTVYRLTGSVPEGPSRARGVEIVESILRSVVLR